MIDVADAVRAAGTLDLTVHRRSEAPGDIRPGKGVNSRYRTLGGKASRNVREWDGYSGTTICDRKMLLEELWVDYAPEPIDRLCPKCFPGASRDEYARTG